METAMPPSASGAPMRIGGPFVLALGVALALAPRPVAADCQPAGPIQEELPRAQVAFVGTAVDVVGSMATFEVHEIWAGMVPNPVEVHGLTSGVEFSEDDRRWDVGTRYLVVPIVDGDVLRDSLCTATTDWHSDLLALRPRTAEILGAGPEEAPMAVPPALLLAGGVIVVLAGASWLAFRRR